MSNKFDIERRWPELFRGLDETQLRGVRNTIASLWHEGFSPSKQDIENLTDYARGDIDANEYKRRAVSIVSRQTVLA
ncbi:MAG: hypothetical protein Q4D87_08015 [Actinomycetaceae bacterium]|nr:hypothetical protein [Actinomycetaceae bacterium]